MSLIVGIDFGHGNVAASYIKLGDKNNDVEQGELVFGRNNEKTFHSVVYGTLENGETVYNLEGRGGIEIQLKSKIGDMTDDQKVVFGKFVNLIFEKIKHCNPKIFFSENKEVDFMLYIAAPSQWDTENKKKYGEFISKNIGHKVEWVLGENEAAYFSNADLTNDRNVLIIDYGSGTIDFALIKNNRHVPLSLKSCELGSSLIENLMLRQYKNDEKGNYEEADRNTFDYLNNHQLTEVIDRNNCLIYELRKSKEEFYKAGSRRNVQEITLNIVNQYAGETLGWEYEYKIPFGVNGIINAPGHTISYAKAVTNELMLLEKLIQKSGQVYELSKIILSGGASQMPWFRDTVASVFKDMKITHENIILDENATHVVSTGIVKYALASKKSLDAVYSDLSVDKIRGVYMNARNKVFEYYFDTQALKSWRDNTKKPKTIDSVNRFIAILNRYIEITGSRAEVNKDILEYVDKFIKDKEAQAQFVDRVKFQLIDDVKNYVENILEKTFKVNLIEYHQIDLQFDDIKMLGVTETFKSSLKDLLVKANTNLFNDEASMERQVSTKKTMKKIIREGVAKFFLDVLPKLQYEEENNLQTQLEILSDTAKEYAKYLFDNNKLFETTFIQQ